MVKATARGPVAAPQKGQTPTPNVNKAPAAAPAQPAQPAQARTPARASAPPTFGKPATKPAAPAAPKVIDVTPEPEAPVDAALESVITAAADTAQEPVTQAEPVADSVAEPEVVTPRPTQAVIQYEAPEVLDIVRTSDGAVSGEFTVDDLQFPSLMIAQGSGDLKAKYGDGSLVLGDELLMLPARAALPGQPPEADPILWFAPVKLAKFYRENLTQEEVQAGVVARTVKTAREALQIAGPNALSWTDNPDTGRREKPRFGNAAAVLMLILKPEGSQHPLFCEELDGQQWALAYFRATNMAYKAVASPLLQMAQTVLNEVQRDDAGKAIIRDGTVLRKCCLPRRLWQFSWGLRPAGEFSVWLPSVKITSTVTPPEALAYSLPLA